MNKAVEEKYITFYDSMKIDDEWKSEMKEAIEACGGKYIDKDFTEPLYKVWLHSNNTVFVWWADVKYCPFCGTKLKESE